MRADSVTIGLTAIFAGVLYAGAMIAPGVGVTGRLICRIPMNLLDWVHAPAYGVLAWLMIKGLTNRRWPTLCAIATGAAASFVFGIWTEVWQASVPGRTASSDDLMIDALGIGSAALLAQYRQRGLVTPQPRFEST